LRRRFIKINTSGQFLELPFLEGGKVMLCPICGSAISRAQLRYGEVDGAICAGHARCLDRYHKIKRAIKKFEGPTFLSNRFTWMYYLGEEQPYRSDSGKKFEGK
jgi:hypothetical protein